MTAMFEGLCHAPRPEHIQVLSEALMSQHVAVASCLDIGDDYKAVAFRGHLNFQVPPVLPCVYHAYEGIPACTLALTVRATVSGWMLLDKEALS